MQFLSVKEAAEKLGASTSAVRRRILPIARDGKHADRALIQPSPAEVKEFNAARTNFGWRIAEELVERFRPEFAEKNSGPQVVKRPRARRGFVLLPRRWVVERTFAWQGRFRRLARDDERRSETLACWRWGAAVMLLRGKAALSSA